MKPLSWITLTTITVCAIMLSGCGASLFSDRKDNPSIQDLAVTPHFWPWSKNGVNTFSTTASRRMVLVKLGDWGDEVMTCAEPSPDVGEAFASAIADGIKIAAQTQGVPVELSNQYAKSVATQITPLVYRTQGLQLYRDAIHGLCVDKMNGWVASETDEIQFKKDGVPQFKSDGSPIMIKKIPQLTKDGALLADPSSYESQRKYFFDEAAKLISLEFPVMKATQAAFFEHSKAGEAKVNIDDATKLLNAVKPAAAKP